MHAMSVYDGRARIGDAIVVIMKEGDALYAERLGNVLRQLRAAAGWKRTEAARRLGVSESTLGNWERGANAPKGYDLSRLFNGYAPYGARVEWFIDPPEVVTRNPVKEALDALAASASNEADRHEERAQARRQQAAVRRVGGPGRSST